MFLAAIDAISGLISKIAHRKSDFKFNNIFLFLENQCLKILNDRDKWRKRSKQTEDFAVS